LPELPEVETVRRGLEQKLNNFIVKKVEVCRDSTVAFPANKEEFVKGLQNSLLYKWNRRGKYLIAELKKIENENIQINEKITFKHNGFLVVHLRMTGYFKFINKSFILSSFIKPSRALSPTPSCDAVKLKRVVSSGNSGQSKIHEFRISALEVIIASR